MSAPPGASATAAPLAPTRVPGARAIAYAAFAVSAWIIYQRFAVHFFSGDDWGFVADVRRWGLDRLTTPVHWYFHPLSWRVYFVGMHALFGFDARAFDGVQIASVFVMAALAWELVTWVSRRPALALLAVAYIVRSSSFALVVGWIACVAYVLALLFELVTLTLVLRACADGAKPRMPTAIAVCVLFAFSWLSKNSTLLFPLPFALLLVARLPDRGRDALLALLAACVLSIAYYAYVLAPYQPTASSGLFSIRSLTTAWSALVFQMPSVLDERFIGFLWPSLFESWIVCAVARAVLASLIVAALIRFVRCRDLASATPIAFTVLACSDIALTAPVNPDRALFQGQVTFGIATALLVSGAFPRRWRGLGASATRRRVEPVLRTLPSVFAALLLISAAASYEDLYVEARREALCQWRQLASVMIEAPEIRPVVGPAPPERADWAPLMAEVFWGPPSDTPASALPPADPERQTFGVRIGESVLRMPYGQRGVACELPPPREAAVSAATRSSALVDSP